VIAYVKGEFQKTSIMTSRRRLKSVDRFVTVLQSINELDGAKISDLATTTGIPRGALTRFVFSLLRLGYIYKDEKSKGYRPTTKTLELSIGAVRDERIKVGVMPHLVRTTQKIGWPLNFSTIRHARLSILAHTDSNSVLVAGSRDTQSLRPLLGRAAGHVLLAYTPEKVREDILKVAHEGDPDLYRRANIKVSKIRSILEEVRNRGYTQTTIPGMDIISTAVPITTHDSLIFALSASFDPQILKPYKSIDLILQPLKACAAAIARKINDIDANRWLSNLPSLHSSS